MGFIAAALLFPGTADAYVAGAFGHKRTSTSAYYSVGIAGSYRTASGAATEAKKRAKKNIKSMGATASTLKVTFKKKNKGYAAQAAGIDSSRDWCWGADWGYSSRAAAVYSACSYAYNYGATKLTYASAKNKSN